MKPKTGHKSKESALNGVANFIQANHSDIVPRVKDGNQLFSFIGNLMRKFLKENELQVKDNGSHGAMSYNANIIQDNWGMFKKFLQNYETT